MRKLPVLLLCCGCFAGGMALNDALTPDEVATAARVLALDFLDREEIEQMLPDLEETRAALDTLGHAGLNNALSPALLFDPFGGVSPLDRATPRTSRVAAPPPDTVRPPANRADLAWYTVEQLASLIYHRHVTSRELTDLFLDRLATHDPTLHCVITRTAAGAREQADRMDRELEAGKYRGPLHGIHYGAKDLLATRDHPTTWGARPYREQRIDTDAAVIEQLREAGAVLCAKLTLGALAWGDVWYADTTRNPWRPSTGSSGSSAGSASAVAAGLLPFAIGTETLGSIVSPSTVCGTTGLRPTYGRVSRYGAMALSWTMDKIGPITRSAGDAALVLAAISADDPRDAHKLAPPFTYPGPAPARKRLGYLRADFAANYTFHDNDSVTLATLRRLGYELVPVELPPAPDIGFVLSVEAAAAFEELTRSGRDDELTRQVRNAWPNVLRAAHFVPAVAYVQANRQRRRLMEQMRDLFRDNDIDVYVNPSWNSRSLFITNLTGQPSLTVPNGFGPEGTPTSITFTGRLLGEAALTEVGRAYQSATGWDERRPPNF